MNKKSDSAATSAGLMAAAGLAFLGWQIPALAQQDDTATLDRVQVTGSRIKRVDIEGPAPVVTITAEDIESRGYTTVLEALNDLPQNAGGGVDQQFTFGFTPSASAIDLRGFGVGRSLVLINGRRQPVFPLAISGTDNFVDLSSIPLGAIERIEILTDGASAIYGSDAVSGVVNVILRDDMQGSELSLRASDTSRGGGDQKRLQFSTGINSDDASALFFLEYLDVGVLSFSDRSFSESDVLGGINGPGPGVFSSGGTPGTFRGENGNVPAANCSTEDPSVGVINGFCSFNRAAFRQLSSPFEQFSITSILRRELGGDIEAFGRFSYFTSTTDTAIEPMFYDEGADSQISAEAPNNPTSSLNDPGGVLYGGPQAGIFRRRLVEFGPRRATIDNNTYSALAGLRGAIGAAYEWEVAAGYTEQRVTSLREGFASRTAINAAIFGQDTDGDGFGDTGTLNLFESIPANVVAALSTNPRTDGLSSVGSLDFQLSGDLMELPAGPAQFSAIAEYNRQRFQDQRDPDTLNGNVIALGGTAGGGDRQYTAVGVELQVPVIDPLIVNLAGRFDNYDDASDVGSAFSPRIAIEYRPLPTLLLRSSAGESFRAPDLQRLFGATTTGFTDLVDTPQCITDGGSGRGDASVASCTQSVQSVEVVTGANLGLREEEGRNFGIGAVWEPLQGLTVGADWFYVKLEQIVNTPSNQFILDQNALDGSFADAIVRLSSEVTTLNPGGLDVVSSQARNLSFQRVAGMDVTGRYQFTVRDIGRFTASLSGTYLDKLEIQENPGEDVVQVLSQGTLGEFVRVKANASLGWSRGSYGATVFGNYIGPFAPDDISSVDRVSSYTTWNLNGTVDAPWNGRFTVGVNNLFDRDPPLDLSDGNNSQPFYNQFFHDALTRNIFVQYEQGF